MNIVFLKTQDAHSLNEIKYKPFIFSLNYKNLLIQTESGNRNQLAFISLRNRTLLILKCAVGPSGR